MAPPDRIPDDALQTWNVRLYPPSTTATSENLRPSTRHALEWYSSEKHTQAWNPSTAFTDEVDPISFLFDEGTVPTITQTAVVNYFPDGREDTRFAGYLISPDWVNVAIVTANRLNSIIRVSIEQSPFYRSNRGMNISGDIPAAFDFETLNFICYYKTEVTSSTESAIRALLDRCGFLTWMGSVNLLWRSKLGVEEGSYLDSLRLEERGKRGVMFKPSADFHEMNIEHWMEHRVPFHYPFTSDENGEGRFVRLRPDYVQEIINIRRERGKVAIKSERLVYLREY
ncbi:hypothetical protein C8R45DRAFT_1089607 [Mycena sanguinolenta]|nr:hypothetical protein C8R45DRAFT_1089607 [Mycena sanguinolenta]